MPVTRLLNIARHRAAACVATLAGQFATVADRAGRRYGVTVSDPPPIDILTQFQRGWVLFGRPGTPRADFIWRTFPARAVITAESAKVPKRLRPIIKRGVFEVRFNEDIEAIIDHTAAGRSSWLTPAAVAKYKQLRQLGALGSVGSYRDGQLVGGLWGIALGPVFSIMSMFHLEDHAGAVAMAALAEQVAAGGGWTFVDCGGLNDNFARYGAQEMATDAFCRRVWTTLSPPPALITPT